MGALSALGLAIACGPKPPPAPTPAPVPGLPVPYGLRAEAANGRATLLWSVDREEATPISGYNIYLSELPLNGDTTAWKAAALKPRDDFPYPGDTDGDINSESYPVDGLLDGRSYAAMVRAMGPGGSEGAPSNVVVFEPLAEGEFVIGANHEASDGGFNFEEGVSVPGRDPRSDLYLFATRDRVGISSPSRLGAGLRKTTLLPRGEKAPSLESIQIVVGSVIDLRTRKGSGVITVEEMIGAFPDIKARIGYEFRPNR